MRWLSLLLLIRVLCADPPLLNVGGGVFNVIKGKKSGIFQLEYRGNSAFFKKQDFWIRPLLGSFITSRASAYFFGGVAFDMFYNRKVAFTPAFAPGVYFRGKGKNLGFPLEFRSSVDLTYNFESKARLGLEFYHISNGSFGFTNPGTECLLLIYSIPLK